MITASLFLLFLLAGCAFVLRYTILAYGLGVIALSSFWLVGSGLVANLLLKPLQVYPMLVSPQWQPANAIVILGGGVSQSPLDGHLQPGVISAVRIIEGARLYHLCKAAQKVCKRHPMQDDHKT